MKSKLLQLAALSGFCLASPHRRHDGLTVRTTSGELTGCVNKTAPSVRQFLGVPFGYPPLDTLRFLPPVRKQDDGPLETTAYAPSCMQRISTAPTIYTEQMPEFLINGGESEDCLYLNVYAPLVNNGTKLPVFIYIPGGGFTGGGADSLYKIPDQWIDKTQTHLVVTMNYRVNLFGFPNAEAAHENVGLLDQRMVVEWVRDNIASFGGDPEQMALWGQSAGGASVGMYGYTYVDDLIVRGLISDSGSTNTLARPAGNHTDFNTIAQLVGCGNSTSAADITCMQGIEATTLQEIYSQTPTVSFGPVGDNITAYSNATDRLARGLVTTAPWIMGFNANEGAGFGTYNESGMTPGQFEIGVNAISCPVVAEANARAEFGYQTYRYYYTGNFSNISPLPWIGASHSAELPILFGTHDEYRGPSTDFEYEVSEGMQALWMEFVRDPYLNPVLEDGTQWPLYKYKPGEKTVAVFAQEGKGWVEFMDEDFSDHYCT